MSSKHQKPNMEDPIYGLSHNLFNNQFLISYMKLYQDMFIFDKDRQMYVMKDNPDVWMTNESISKGMTQFILSSKMNRLCDENFKVYLNACRARKEIILKSRKENDIGRNS